MGQGAVDKLPQVLPQGKVLVITDKGLLATGMVDRLCQHIPHAHIFSDIDTEPTTKDLDQALDMFRTGAYTAVVGIGGGSALDMAKAVAALGNTPMAAAEGLGNHPKSTRDTFSVAIPTTAGTGSESTLNAIFIDSCDGVKKAIVSPACVPDVAVLDPDLVVSLPPSLTASTGIDALCHCVESFISVKANPLSEVWSIRGIHLIEANLPQAVANPEDTHARLHMLVASYCGGAALAIAGTNAVHALAYPLGKRGVPHGVANSLLFLPVMAFNLPACEDKFLALAKGEATPQAVLARMGALVTSLPIPSITAYPITAADIDTLAAEAMEQTRLLGNNPRDMSLQQARDIYQTLFSEQNA